MEVAEQTVIEALYSLSDGQDAWGIESLQSADPSLLGEIYSTTGFASEAFVYLKEQLWLRKNAGEITSWESFARECLSERVYSASFLESLAIDQGSDRMTSLTKMASNLQEQVLQSILQESAEVQKSFSQSALRHMLQRFLDEEDNEEGPRLYRIYDSIDKIFNLNYDLDGDLSRSPEVDERLYIGSGVGVQSGYSTILLSLHHCQLKTGGTVIDLGSGYGRVGLVYALVRPDINFIGYEYMDPRVVNSNEAARHLGLESHLNFVTQDLSLASFQIPEADVYYMYDPFTKETYHHVLAQIIDISKRKKITVVTKGNARGWLLDIADQCSWPEHQEIDGGNLCIFQSHA